MVGRFSGVLVAALLLACSPEDITPGALALTLGHETDTWSLTPAPVRVELRKLLADGTRVELGRAPAPIARVSLGEGADGVFEVAGLDADDARRVTGRSVALSPAGLAGMVLPLFVGRADRFSRPPGELSSARGERPRVAVVGGRHFLVAEAAADGGITLDGYDFGVFAPHRAYPPLTCPSEPCAPRSLAVVDATLAVVIGDDFGLTLDTASGATSSFAPPDGLASCAELAGARAVERGDGSACLVGATRDAPPSSAVLCVSADGEPTVLRLATPRAGAAATWLAGRGLVVAGGSASGPGAELLADGATAFASLPFPPDPTRGAALAPLDADSALRLGGRDDAGEPAPTVRLALGCANDCQAEAASPDLALDRAEAFGFDGGVIIVVGDGPDGLSAAFRRDDASATPLPLREPRRGATASRTPTGAVALVGGAHPDGTPATTLELVLP
ncbi:MAG: hypothetical protein OZ921_19535 [Sorangiineae bacterium]|nr:hypothetical protein [Sorangiineae bacterium]